MDFFFFNDDEQGAAEAKVGSMNLAAKSWGEVSDHILPYYRQPLNLSFDPPIGSIDWDALGAVPMSMLTELESNWVVASYSDRVRILNQLLDGVTDPLERIRIIREFNASFKVKTITPRKKQNLGRKVVSVLRTQRIVKGIVKILFSPLRINLDSLHPTKSVA